MVKIIAGGLKGEKPRENITTVPIQSLQQDPENEGWYEYIKRNVGGAVENLAALPQALQNAAPGRQTREYLEQLPEFKNLPPQQSVAEQLPELYKQNIGTFGPPRNFGEEAFRFGVSELPLIALTKGFSSPEAFLKSALSSITGAAGSYLGQEAGGEIGEALGNREKGELIGGLSGGALGNILPTAYSERLSKTAPDKIYEKESKILEETQKKLFEQNLKSNTFQKAKDKLLLERANKLKKLETATIERSDKIKKLESERHPEYKKAEEVAKTIKAEPSPEVEKALKNIKESARHGVEQVERTRIYDMADQLEDLIRSGTASLSELKAFKQNVNQALYNKNLPPVVTKHYRDIRNALNEHITRIGEKYPSHGEPFAAAEKKTIEYKKLLEENKAFNTAQKEQRKSINEEYKSDIRNIAEQEKIAKQQQQFINISNKDQEKLAQTINNISNKVNKWGLSGLASILTFFVKKNPTLAALYGGTIALGKSLHNEFKFANQVFKNHPELVTQYGELLTKEAIQNLPKLANRLNSLGKKIEHYVPEDNKKQTQSNYKILKGGLKS